MTTEEARELVRKHVLELGEHFESVRIFVTRASPEEHHDTQAIDNGTGNFYAQFGQIQEWMSIQDEYQRIWAKKNNTPEEEP